MTYMKFTNLFGVKNKNKLTDRVIKMCGQWLVSKDLNISESPKQLLSAKIEDC